MSLLSQLVRVAYDHRRLFKWLIPARPVLVKLEGFSMYVRLDDWAVGARIAVKRRYEPHVVAVFRKLLGPGAVVVDVGANAGYYSLTAASIVGRAGRVYAFEPGAISCRLLERSAAANGFANIQVFECAVSDREELVGYGMDDSNGRITHEGVARAELQVRSVTLDRALAGLRPVQVIKIDVEGAEARVVRGAMELIRRDHPAIVSEFCPYGLRLASSIEPGEYLDLLRSLGYELRVIPVDGPVPPPQEDARILDQVRGDGPEDHVDLLATRTT